MSNEEESEGGEEMKVSVVKGEKDKIGDSHILSKDTILENNKSSIGGTSTRGSVNEYSFFDEAIIYVRAGSGGQGGSTYKKGVKGQNTQPDGGNGGKGGDVLIMADQSLNTLAGLATSTGSNFLQSFRAENGQDGDRQFRNGRYGNDITIRVPPGTIVEEQIIKKSVGDDDPEDEVIDLIEIGTVILPNSNNDENEDEGEYYYSDSMKKKKEVLVVAKGGEGGEGSASSQAKGGRGVRRARASPVGGERKRLKLTLKIVADVALVGVPNAGKSTFLASVTRAKPKIANYPFTTVIPNLGVWVPSQNKNDQDEHYKQFQKNKEITNVDASGSSGLVLCDVPGLIAGAAEGIGLGHAFLRHVERCHVILHLVDATSTDPVGDFIMVNREILRYGSGKLAQMPQVVVVNKIDTWDENNNEMLQSEKEELETKLLEVMAHSRLMWMSAKERDGVDDLMTRMAAFVRKVKDSS